MLDRKLRNRLIDNLILVPGTQALDGRTDLLNGLPGNVIAALNRDQSAIVDLGNIITWLEGLGRLEKTGERPLLIVADNALRRVQGAELGRTLQEIIAEMEEQYGGKEPPGEIGLTPEILIFKGRDFRLSITYLQRALESARGVARLMVPRYFGGTLKGSSGFGTGWLVAPGLLLTNRHVVAAHSRGSRPSARRT